MRELVRTNRVSGMAYEPAWLAGQLVTVYLPWLLASLITWAVFHRGRAGLTLVGKAAATIPAATVERRPDGTAILKPGAALTPQGAYAYVDHEVKFAVAGHAAILREQTPLLGLRNAGEVTEHNPEYLASAKAYAVNAPEIAALKKETRPVTVRIYYGSWCPHCRRMVPHALRVEQELKGSKIRFEYFGLPPGFGSDPEAQKAVVQSLPTGVVLIQGTEVGRLLGDEVWKSPESTLHTILAAKGAAGG